jgi:hypothetical protein
MRKKQFFFVVLVLLMMSVAAVAQVRTGILTGRILDNLGEPLPGVTVTVTSPAMIQATRSEVTNDRGMYRFINLDPGVYSLRAELQAFVPYEQKDIRVRLGLTSTVDVKLTAGNLQTEVQVVAQSPVVDVESNRLSTNFTTEMLAKLPSTRNLESFFKMTPGMIVDFGADPKYPERSAFGSGSRENYYSVDGTYLTDPGAGTQMIYWNYDIIEEAQVEGTGHDAQYGNSAGAVINVITKSGGDKFSGLVNFYYRNKSMSTDNFKGTGLSGSTNAIKNEWEGSFNLGGPIVKEKVWFFLSGNMMPTLSNTVGFDAEINRRQYYAFGKVTAQLGPKNRLSLMYNNSRDKLNHMFASQFRTPESTLNSLQWTSAFNLQWNYMLDANSLIETRAAFVDRATTYVSNGPGPSYYELTTGMMTKSAGFHNEQTRRRYQFQASVSHWAENFVGDHDLKLGVDFERGESGYDGWMQSDYPGGPSFIYTYYGVPYIAEVAVPDHIQANNIFQGLSFYAQDTWKLGTRLNINFGARLNSVKSSVPEQTNVPSAITEYKFTNFEPRIGVVYDLSTGGRQMAVKAHYGRYYTNSMALGLLNPNAQTYYDYLLLEGKLDGEKMLIGVYGPKGVTVDPNLKRPYSDTFVLGFETSLTRDLAFKVNGIYKKSQNFIGTIDLARTADWYRPIQVMNPFTNSAMTVYDLKPGAPVVSQSFYTNPSQANRDYKGVQFILEKNLSHHYQFLASYTYSKAKGTVPQGTWGSGGMTASGTWNNPNMFINTRGLLDLDKTHEVKFSGVYYAPFGITLGVNFIGQSGMPYARVFSVILSTGPTTFNAETPGAKRTPFQSMIDVRLEKSFQLGRTRPSVFFEAFNLLNSNTAIGIGSLYKSPTFDKITAILPPRILRLGVALNF